MASIIWIFDVSNVTWNKFKKGKNISKKIRR